MNKKMRELMASIQKKTEEAKTLLQGENKDIEKANAVMDEVETLQCEFDAEKRVFEAEKGAVTASKEVEDPAIKKEKEPTNIEKFAKFVKSVIVGKAVEIPSESVAENGGYTVPEDIQTEINNWKESEFSFLDEIDVVPVSTNKGARTYQKKGQAEVLTDLDENGAITGQITTPKFERVTYNIKDRAGFMPVSNDLINDSTTDIKDFIIKWLSKCNIATTNAKVLDIINTKTQTNFKDLKGIKKAVNVTLGQAYRGGVVIYTNDDGLDYLDTLEDKNGRPLLNPDPTVPAQLQLRCGATVVPVKVVPNAVIASDGTKVPFIIGDLKEAIRKWDRQSISIDGSSVASIGEFNAYEKNMTLMRAIVRDDYTVLDVDAFVQGYIDVPVAES